MKKYKKIIVYLILIICLISSAILVNLLINRTKEEKKFELSKIVEDVNLATSAHFMEQVIFENDVFEAGDNQLETDVFYGDQLDRLENDELLDEMESINNIPITIEENTKYIMAKEINSNEYFLLIEEPTKNQIKEFDKFKKNSDKNIKFGKNSKYIYLINSKEFSSTIEGIIRSYIY